MSSSIQKPAHRDNNGLSLKDRVDQLKRHHKLRLNEIMEILRSAGKAGLTPYEVAGKMQWSFHGKNFHTVSEQQRWFAMGETRAHFFYLLSKGKVTLIDGIGGRNRYYPSDICKRKEL